MNNIKTVIYPSVDAFGKAQKAVATRSVVGKAASIGALPIAVVAGGAAGYYLPRGVDKLTGWMSGGDVIEKHPDEWGNVSTDYSDARMTSKAAGIMAGVVAGVTGIAGISSKKRVIPSVALAASGAALVVGTWSHPVDPKVDLREQKSDTGS